MGWRKLRSCAMAVRSGCVRNVTSELTMPVIHNDRGIAVANDTHAFDLHQLSPVFSNGWVLLGDLERYVAASHKRFASIEATAEAEADSGTASSLLRVAVIGAPAERLRVTALRPQGGVPLGEWDAVTQNVAFAASCNKEKVLGQAEAACVSAVVFI